MSFLKNNENNRIMNENNKNINRLKASLVSGVIEVGATHPLDYLKTLLQKNGNKVNVQEIKESMKTPYKGVGSRLIGVVPMRILFWNSLDYFKTKGCNPIIAGFYTSIIQTSIDYPIEQIKTQQMIQNNYQKTNFFSYFKDVKFYPSVMSHLGRNAGFAVIMNQIIQKKPDSMYYGAIGGFVASLVTHPFDTLKTWYMTGNKNYPKHWTFKDFMRGWHYRCGISLISMNIGWIIYYRLSNQTLKN